MRKKLYTIIDKKDIPGIRDILETDPGETRYFEYEDGIPVRAIGGEGDKRLTIQKYIDGEWVPGLNVISASMNGTPLEEIDKENFDMLVKKVDQEFEHGNVNPASDDY